MKSPEIFLLSLILTDDGGKGHNFSYAESVGQAARLNGWGHVVISSKNIPERLTSSVKSTLKGCREIDVQKKTIGRTFLRRVVLILNAFRLIVSLHKTLKNEIKAKKSYLLFLDSFGPLEIISLFFSIVFIQRNNMSLWLVYRKDDFNSVITGFIYKYFTNLLKYLISDIKLLTDSELLSKSLSSFFKKEISVLPIPHTEDVLPIKLPKSHNKLTAWWPGQPSHLKGWNTIKHLLALRSSVSKKICIIATQSSDLISNNKEIEILLTNNYLTRSEYLQFMYSSDIILLPYNTSSAIDSYRERTSGIFVETIMASKVPLVSQNSWMSHELYKYELEELCIDWDSLNILEKIIQLSKSELVRKKICRMRKSYSEIHCKQNFALTIKKLLSNEIKR